MATKPIAAFAKDARKMPVSGAKIHPTVEYVGTDNKAGTFFLVKLETEAPIRFLLSIRNENGEVLYSQEYETSNFSKYIKLQNEGTESDLALYFTIQSLPNGENHRFDVNTVVKMVKDVVVTKL